MTKVRGDGLDVEGLRPPARMAEVEAASRQLASSAADVASVAAAEAAARPLAHAVEASSSAAMMAAAEAAVRPQTAEAEAAVRPQTAEAEAAARVTSAEAAGAALRATMVPAAESVGVRAPLAPVVVAALNGARPSMAAAFARVAPPPAMRMQQEPERIARMRREIGGPRVLRELNQQAAALRSMGLAPRLGSAQFYDPAPSRPVASPAPAAPIAPAPVVAAPVVEGSAESKSEREKQLRREAAAKRGAVLRAMEPAALRLRLVKLLKPRGKPAPKVAHVAAMHGMTADELRALQASVAPVKPPRKHRRTR